MYNLFGQLIKQVDVAQQTGLNTMNLAINELPAGMYILQVVGIQSTGLFVKN